MCSMTRIDMNQDWTMEQDAEFDEKFPRDHDLFATGKVKVLKYLHTRDLAIEEAVRAELVEKIKEMGKSGDAFSEWSPDHEADGYNQALWEVIDLLTTSPSP